MTVPFAREPFTALSSGTYGTIYESRSLPQLSITDLINNVSAECFEMTRSEPTGVQRPSAGKRLLQVTITRNEAEKILFVLETWFRINNSVSIQQMRDRLNSFVKNKKEHIITGRIAPEVLVQLKEYWKQIKDVECKNFANRLAFETHLYLNRDKSCTYELTTQTYIPSSSTLDTLKKTKAFADVYEVVRLSTGVDFGLPGYAAKSGYNFGIGQYFESDALNYRQGQGLQYQAFAELELARGLSKEFYPDTFDLSSRQACNLILKRTCKYYQDNFDQKKRDELSKKLWSTPYSDATWNAAELSYGFSTALSVKERWNLTKYFVHMYTSIHVFIKYETST
ncbi:spike protein [Taro reovirus 1]|nr:spike protein [Taro reovirus 1]